MVIRSFLSWKSWWKNYIYWLLESPCFELFRGEKTIFFLRQKVDEKMIFTDYWKVFLLNFSEMGNRVFFWAKTLMERWYLLGLYELSMVFQDLGNMVFRAVFRTSDNFLYEHLYLFHNMVNVYYLFMIKWNFVLF